MAESSSIKLTPKQEAFCKAIVDGYSQIDAYKLAYKSENSKQSTLANNAYMLMQRSDISARIEEIRAPLIEKVLWSLEDSVNTLKSIVNKQDVQDKDSINAIKELNAMFGYKAAVKQDITSNGKDLPIKSITIVNAEGLMLDND